MKTVAIRNETAQTIGRAGRLFPPNSVVDVSVSEYELAEIVACRGLSVEPKQEQEIKPAAKQQGKKA